MRLSLQKLVSNLKNINTLIENSHYEEAYREYQNTHKDIEMNRYVITELADFYASYAYFCFSSKEINQFFEMYIRAQKYGYPGEKRRDFIYKAFIEPNLSIFRLNYMQNMKLLLAKGCIQETIDFEELQYWLLPTGNKDEFYLYEKDTNLIKENFRLNSDDNQSLVLKITQSSSDYLIKNNGSWADIQSYINRINPWGKKCYIIDNHFKKLFSYLQGGIINQSFLSGLVIFNTEDQFESYFIYNSSYIPRHLICADEERPIYEKLIDKIHYYRLNKENRHGDNVLLSICIPSYNRGRRAYENILHTLQSLYDEEIEIVLSNNGTQNESQEFYSKINQIEDSRLVYYEFEENQGFAINLCQVADLAKGKYILLLSDEDLVNLTELESLVNQLNSISDVITIIRTRTDKQGVVPYIGTTNPGRDSLFAFMLSSNYMSGIIYNKQMLVNHHLLEYIKQNSENQACLTYPQMVWELILCQYGKVQGMDIVLIYEGQAEKTEVSQTRIGFAKEITIPGYAALKGRLDQHEGFFNIVKDLEISKADFDIFRELYRRLCAKTIFLVILSIDVFYKQTDINPGELLESTYNHLLKYLNEIYQEQENSNNGKYIEDKTAIRQLYEYYKNIVR